MRLKVIDFHTLIKYIPVIYFGRLKEHVSNEEVS